MNAVLIFWSRRAAVARREQLAQPQRDRPQALGVEGHELELGLPQAGEAALLQEPDPVVERREAGDAVPGVEELRRAGEDPQQARVGARGVGDLADAVQRLVPRVRPHAQDRLGLVDDDEQPLVAGGLHDLEHAAQVVEGIAAADVALDARGLLRRRGDVAAAAQPGDERAGLRDLALLLQLEDGLDDADEVLRRLPAGQRREVLVEALPHLRVEVGGRVVLARRDRGSPRPGRSSGRGCRRARRAGTTRCRARSSPCGTRRRSGGTRRSLSETTTKLVAKPRACASSSARRAMKVLPQP